MHGSLFVGADMRVWGERKAESEKKKVRKEK